MAFPEDVLADMDVLTTGTNQRRSDLIREACSLYVEEKRRIRLRERMKAGYQEMAELNRLLAEELAGDFGFELPPATDEGEFSRDKDGGDASSWRKA